MYKSESQWHSNSFSILVPLTCKMYVVNAKYLVMWAITIKLHNIKKNLRCQFRISIMFIGVHTVGKYSGVFKCNMAIRL